MVERQLHSRLSLGKAASAKALIAGCPLAAGTLYPARGWLRNPMWAGATLTLSSVSVITNARRLRSARP